MGRITFEESLEKIKELVNNFDKDYKNKKQLNEENVKHYYINPFLEALGWVIGDNTKHLNKRDVTFEHRVYIKEGRGKKAKSVDYSMRIGGVPQFFLEAKQPSKNLKEDNTYSFQLRRYGFSAGLPLNILTDFEELSIYDCRIKPKVSDSTKIGQKYYFEYKDYEKNWEIIWDLFSREKVENGSLDWYKEEKIKGTSRVDKEFLSYIEKWREELAKNICLRNRDISESNLNYAVQKIIDRIIFLRICESRGIEIEETLKNAVDKEHTYKNLINIFKNADEKYNSGLFHFKKEENIKEEADNITPKLIIDAKILNDIIESLYEGCPYEFSVFPADILGRVYEQFLGKVISHKENSIKVIVEEKQEVRKAGGVYYTPEYIVKYIVEHTVGILAEGKKIKELEQIKVIDPACGSGSFLIVAYQFLLDRYLELYIEDGAEKYLKGKKPAIFQSDDGSYQLTLEERKKILLNNIFGVDIDAQAVEVTKLSLLLKVLEYEGEEIKQQTLFNERVLPDLFNNIKCGNSLVESDINSGVLVFDTKELIKINPFDWNDEFAGIMNNGGFDCVIGNPPYVDKQTIFSNSEIQSKYLSEKYKEFVSGNYDLYLLFIIKGFFLMKESGLLGFINPHKFFQTENAKLLRDFLANKKTIKRIIHFGTNQIFGEDLTKKDGLPSTYTCLLFLGKREYKNLEYKEFSLGDAYKKLDKLNFRLYLNEMLKGTMWNFNFGDDKKIIEKLRFGKKTLEDITTNIFKGSSTGNDNVYVLKIIKRGNYESTFYSKEINSNIIIENEIVKKYIRGEDVRKYMLNGGEYFLLYPYFYDGDKVVMYDYNELKKNYPQAFDYLSQCKKRLFERSISCNNQNFYQFSAERSLIKYERTKIIIPDLSQGRIGYDENGEFYHNASAHSILFNKEKVNFGDKFYLGILNSKIFIYFIKKTSTSMKGDTPRLTPLFIKQFPVPQESLIDQSNREQLILSVDKMLTLQKHFHTSNSTQEKAIYEKQIAMVDKEIDSIVYKLYNLTEEEIALIESSV